MGFVAFKKRTKPCEHVCNATECLDLMFIRYVGLTGVFFLIEHLDLRGIEIWKG